MLSWVSPLVLILALFFHPSATQMSRPSGATTSAPRSTKPCIHTLLGFWVKTNGFCFSSSFYISPAGLAWLTL